MSRLKAGMAYEDVAHRVKRIAAGPGDPQAKSNLVGSLVNQCRIAEGEEASRELIRECLPSKKESSFLSGSGSKQTGWGPGVKLGDGRWRFVDGGWVRV